jgi:hypothetical protein
VALDSRIAGSETTAPWPALEADDSGTFRWLRPGELLAIPVPTTALQLGALLRHLEIDGEFGDWPAATIHLAQARSMWQRLEPALSRRVAAHTHMRGARKAGKDMARALERAAAALRRCDGEQVVEVAREAIGLVEAVERVFE